ncbi:hypothetical protein EV13_0058 [Prochlorococcus sp. MIT 0702]|nr:hypothetical protein EV13_0058 [Prochlorococcus sp. MIT 0702]
MLNNTELHTHSPCISRGFLFLKSLSNHKKVIQCLAPLTFDKLPSCLVQQASISNSSWHSSQIYLQLL